MSPLPSTRRSRARAVAALFVIAAVATLAGAPAAGAAPVPDERILGTGDQLLGTTFTITAEFDNAGTDTGYGPFIDLVLPRNGADGSAGTDTPDGIDFVGASYLGLDVGQTRIVFGDDDGPGGSTTGTIVHPLTGESITGTAGDVLVVLAAPLGSFTPDQPVAPVEVELSLSALADPGVMLPIAHRSGFALGADPLDNPGTDPFLVSDPSTTSASWATDPVTPTVMTLEKRYLGPEAETATGPNFERQYELVVDIAEGQRVDDLELVDSLPPEVAFLRVDTLPPGGTVTTSPPVGVSANGSLLEVNVATVTGGSGERDVVVGYSVFVDRVDGDGMAVLAPGTGATATVRNSADAQGDWDPVDTRDPASADNVAAGPAEEEITARSVATQKRVSNLTDLQNSPGDVLEYTIDVQLSDYVAVQDLVVSDVLSDGQRLDATFTPTLSVTEGGATSSGPMTELDVTERFTGAPSPTPPIDGTTEIAFRVSDELAARGADTQLLGGCVPAGGTGGPEPDCSTSNAGATTAEIRFRAVIQSEFSDDVPSGDSSVDQGDRLGNTVDATADVVDSADLNPTGATTTDTSGAGLTVAVGGLVKSLYQVNGVTPPTPAEISPGDVVTWRLRYTHPTTGFEDFALEDYLPLPAFDATEVAAFDAGTVSSAAPAAGRAHYHPDDTLHLLTGAPDPALSTTGADNLVRFDYGNFDADPDVASVSDLLVSVTATDEPFADELDLTNIAQSLTGTTNAGAQAETDGAQVILGQPELVITKGAVATDATGATFTPAPPGPVAFSAPGSAAPRQAGTISSSALAATPVDSNVSGLDAGDRVSFAVVVENLGSSVNGAFDVAVSDDLPAGFVVPAGGLNLAVTDGAGVALPFTDLGGGLFGTGIRLDDGSVGSLAPFDDDAGDNIAVITYDLELAADVEPGDAIQNLAALDGYAGTEGGPNHLDSPETDPAFAAVEQVALAKTVDGTSEPHTTGTSVAIGEIVRYRIELLLPEGAIDGAVLRDELPAGLQFLDDGTATVAFVSDSGSAITSSTLSGAGLGATGDELTVGSVDPAFAIPPGAVSGGPFGSGTDVAVALGDLVNAERDADDELVVVELNALVLNQSGNQDATVRNNRAALDRAAGGTVTSPNRSVTVREAAPTVSKAVTSSGPYDAGDTVDVRIRVANPSSSITAFDVVTSDPLPAGLTFVPGSVATNSTGTVSGLADTSAADTVSFTVDSMEPSSTVTVTFSATIDADVSPLETLTNVAGMEWTSLPGTSSGANPTGSTTPGGSGSSTGERTGAGGVNDLRRSSTAPVTVAPVTVTKAIVGTSAAHTSGTDVVVGEEISYDVTVRFPEGSTSDAVLSDAFGAGLELRSAAVTSVGTNLTVERPAPTPVTDSGTVSLDVGDVTNAADGVASSDDEITVRLVLRVRNVAANVDGAAARNTAATLTYTGGSAQSGPVDASVVEPDLSLAKSFSPTNVDAGDTVTLTLQLSHSGGSSADAFDVTLSDTMPTGLSLDSITSIVATGGASGVVDSSAGDQISVAVDSLPLGGTVTVTAEVSVGTAVQPSEELVNVSSTEWTSLSGSDPAERTGAGGVDDYRDTDSAALSIDDPELTKTLVATDHGPSTGSQVIIGETITFEVELTLPEGSTPAFDLTDDLPAGTEYVPGSVVVDDTGFGGTLSASSSNEPTGDGFDLVVSFTGTTTVDADGDTGNDSITVTYQVVVLDVAANRDGTDLVNEASALGVSDDATVTVVRPSLGITKTDGGASVAPGGVVTYTLELSNSGGIAATGITVTETVPDDSTFDAAGSSPGWSCSDGDPAGTTCTRAAADVAPGASALVDFAVRVVDPAPAGLDQLTNTASVAGDEANGPDDDPSDDSDTDTTPVDAAPVLEITKDDGGASVNPGSDVTYVIDVTNSGTQDATGVVVTETVPANTTFDAGAASAGWSCADDAPAGTTCTATLGDLSVGETRSLAFAITVDEPVPDGVTGVTNTASVADDGTNTGGTPVTGSDTDSTPVTAEADLSVVKSTTTPSVDGGDEVRFTIGAANSGPNAAAAPVRVADTLPPELTFVSATGSGWSCSATAGGFECTYGDPTATSAPVGDLGTIDVVATAAPNVDDTVTNVVTIGSPTSDPDLSGNSDTADVQIASTADLVIAKDHAPADFSAGGQGTFTLTIGNDGPSDSVATPADPVIVTDDLPDDLTIASVSAPGWDCSRSTTTELDCRFGSTIGAAGPDPAAIVVTVDLADDIVGATPVDIVNTATVAAGVTPDPDSSNDSADDTVTVRPSADLSIDKTLVGDLVAGDEATYRLVVRNLGPSPVAGDITVSDDLPTGLSLVRSESTDPWVCAGTTGVSCVLAGPTAPGTSSTLDLIVLVAPDAPSPVTNTASVTSATDDPDTSNNTDTSGSPDPVTPSVDLEVTKVGPSATLDVGSEAEFSLQVSNNGPNDATGTTTLTDVLPDGLGWARFEEVPAGWTCPDPTDDRIECTTTDTIANSATVGPFRIVVDVGAEAYPGVTNTATVAADPSLDEDDPSNDSDDAAVDVAAYADLAVVKSHTGDFAVGEQAIWTLRITNNGPTDHPGPISLTDTVPPGTTAVSAVGDGFACTIDVQDVDCSHPNGLGVGESATVVLTVLPSAGAEGTVENTATVSSSERDPDPGNDSFTDEVTVEPRWDLAITKTLADPLLGGSPARWAIVVTNAGPSPSEQLTITDELPEGLTAVSAGSDDPLVSCSISDRLISCDRSGRLGVGEQTRIDIVTRVDAEPGEQIVNVATVDSGGDVASANDTDTAAGTVAGAGVAVPTVEPAGTVDDAPSTVPSPLASTGGGTRALTVGAWLTIAGAALCGVGRARRRRTPGR